MPSARAARRAAVPLLRKHPSLHGDGAPRGAPRRRVQPADDDGEAGDDADTEDDDGQQSDHAPEYGADPPGCDKRGSAQPASATTSAKPLASPSTSAEGSLTDAGSRFTPMKHVPSCEISVIIAAHPGSGPNGYIAVIRAPAM